MKEKLTTLERRAKAACEEIAKYGSQGISVQWIKSSTWGHCPRILWRGDKAAYAGGCGYDKISAVLAEFLQFLPGVDELLRYAGAGLSSIQSKLAEGGWKLEQTYNGKAEDGFRISKSTDFIVKP